MNLLVNMALKYGLLPANTILCPLILEFPTHNITSQSSSCSLNEENTANNSLLCAASVNCTDVCLASSIGLKVDVIFDCAMLENRNAIVVIDGKEKTIICICMYMYVYVCICMYMYEYV